MRIVTTLIVAFSALAALLAPTPAVAQEPPPAVRVGIGGGRVTGLVHHGASGRVVVTVGDEVRLFDLDGIRTATIGGIPGAMDPEEAGDLVVVGSPPVGELVVIDPAAGTIVKRISVGAQRLSSLDVVGDRVWYAHGPDQWDAGVGVASIAAGTATPNQDVGALGTYAGSVIAASAARPDRVYLARASLSPTGLRWGDLEGNNAFEPNHASFVPFTVADDGSAVWALSNRNLIELDPDTLERTGFFFQDAWLNGSAILANHDDRRLALASGTVVTQYDVGVARAARTTTFPSDVLGIDVSETLLMVATGDELIMLGRSADLPTPVLSIGLFGFGSPWTEHRGTLSYSCNTIVGIIPIRYGTITDLAIPAGTVSCNLAVDGGSRPLSRTFATAAGQTVADAITVRITGDPTVDWVDVVDEYPSVYTDARLFTRQMFVDLLDREPTAAEYTSWERQLRDGLAPERLASSLIESPEFLGQIAPVTRLYRAYFRRQPDDPGLSYWLRQVRNGLSIDDVSWLFGESVEFQRRYGALTDAEFVELVYRNVLGRPSDPKGAAYWQAVLADGTTRARVMTAFSESREFVRQTESAIAVRALYYGLLGREPDPEGDAYWRSVYDAGQPLDVLVRSFLESVEYQNRFWIADEIGPAAALRAPQADPAPAAPLLAERP